MSRRPDESQNGAPTTRLADSRLAYVLQAGKDRQAAIDAKHAAATPVSTSEAISEDTSESIGLSLFGKKSKRYKYKDNDSLTVKKLVDVLLVDFKRTASAKRFNKREPDDSYEHVLDSGIGVFATVWIYKDSYKVSARTESVNNAQDLMVTEWFSATIDEEMTFNELVESLRVIMRQVVAQLVGQLEEKRKKDAIELATRVTQLLDANNPPVGTGEELDP